MFKYLVLFALIAVAFAKPGVYAPAISYASPLTYSSTYNSLPLTYAANTYAAAPYAAPYAYNAGYYSGLPAYDYNRGYLL